LPVVGAAAVVVAVAAAADVAVVVAVAAAGVVAVAVDVAVVAVVAGVVVVVVAGVADVDTAVDTAMATVAAAGTTKTTSASAATDTCVDPASRDAIANKKKVCRATDTPFCLGDRMRPEFKTSSRDAAGWIARYQLERSAAPWTRSVHHRTRRPRAAPEPRIVAGKTVSTSSCRCGLSPDFPALAFPFSEILQRTIASWKDERR
jgi:hypothetical protein